MATCPSFPSTSGPLISSSSSVPFSRPKIATSVRRSGSKLYDDDDGGREFKITGANVYWLGLDENVAPWPTYPSKQRILDAFATVSAMGGTTVRSQTLGISVGSEKSVEPSLDVFSEQAFDTIDFSIYAARMYGIRLIIPLVDAYDYYHGGIYTFLRWHNLSASSSSDFGPFWDTSSAVYTSFTNYVGTVLNHTSNYTGLAMKNDPTVLAFELGNELPSPPASWSTSVSSLVKLLSPTTLTISGTYGLQSSEFSIPSLDILSNHYYPLVKGKYGSEASTAAKAGKAYYVGEYDWVSKTRVWTDFAFCAIPLGLALLVWFLPAKWFQRRYALPWRRRRRRRGGKGSAVAEKGQRSGQELVGEGSATMFFPEPSDGATPSYSSLPTPTPTKTPFSDPLSSPYPPLPSSHPLTYSDTAIHDHPEKASFRLRKLHLCLFFLLWVPLSAVIIYFCSPDSLSHFFGEIEKNAGGSGALVWSLFGKDDRCCNYVDHNDGFTLHYPDGTSSSQASRILDIVRFGYSYSGLVANFTPSGGLAALTTAELPNVACPQANLTLANGTTIG